MTPNDTRRLSDVAAVNPGMERKIAPDELVSFVPMADANAESATTSSGQDVTHDKVSVGYTPFIRNDILVAKITPCFENGKIVQATIGRERGAGSTEFHVIRPDERYLDARYLLHFLRQPNVRAVGAQRMTGTAGQRRIPESFLAELQIPVPDMTNQRRVADVMVAADRLSLARRAVLERLDELTKAVFSETFGSPDGQLWPTITVGAVALQVTDGEHLTPKREQSGIKLLSARNVRDGYLEFENVDYIGQEEYERIRRHCAPQFGDILISCSGTIGRVAVVETTEPFALVRSAALVKPNTKLITAEYLATYLRTPALKAKMLQSAKASSQANLFQGPIKQLPVPLPPLELQFRFGEQLRAISLLRQQYQGQLSQLQDLLSSIRHRAFAGAL
jgi:type I restriction enzyme S subunit